MSRFWAVLAGSMAMAFGASLIADAFGVTAIGAAQVSLGVFALCLGAWIWRQGQ